MGSTSRLLVTPSPVADPDLELRGQAGRGGFALLALQAFLPSVLSSFLSKINRGGWGVLVRFKS